VKLNLGCGREYRPGWINIDKDSAVEPDMVVDLDRVPWPLPDAIADTILLKFVLEHLGQSTADFNGVMGELYRIAKPGAVIEIHSRHPQHSDFLDDPSCVRKITPTILSFYDHGAGEVWCAAKELKRSIAPSLGVDFELIDALYFPDAQIAGRQFDGGRPIAELAQIYNNVIRSTTTKLKVHKPLRLGRSLQRYGALCIERHGGLGDVIMALAAANAVKQISGKPVYLITAEPMRALAEACPVLDGVLIGENAAAVLDERYREQGGVLRAEVGAAMYGLSRLHQVDAYLEDFGLVAPASVKEVVLRDPNAEQHARFAESLPAPSDGCKRVLVHPAIGDANRTWPAANWRELCERLSGDGHQVVMIGSSTHLPGRGVHAIDVPGVIDARDRLDFLETVALMRASDVLVSTDSGPIQLAAATAIHIVGIYSVVSGRQRLPFRQGVQGWRATALGPACSFSPCYMWMHDTEVVAKSASRSLLRVYSDWCLNPAKYSCMTEEITVDRVYEAVCATSRDAGLSDAPRAHQDIHVAK
jgi:ADP-heptose:LPS heptosyltransferase